MEIKTSVFKRSSRVKRITLKDGSLKDTKLSGGWFYRLRYFDEDGIARTLERGPFDLKRGAETERDISVRKITKTSGRIRTGEKMTFDDLATECKADIYDGRKSSANESIINTLCVFFGKMRIESIDRGVIENYVRHRAKQTIRIAKNDDLKRPIKRSTIDRELRIMRSMIYHALDEGWLIRNPFRPSKKLKPLIQKAQGDRDRTLSVEEEWRLLESCEPRKRTINYTRMMPAKGQDVKVAREESFERETGNEWLKAAILLGLDCGMRRGEILQLKWSDIDFNSLMIAIPAEYTKTKKARTVGVTDRLAAELWRIRPMSESGKIFPFQWIARSFNTAVRMAKIDDFTFRDLRRTFDSRQDADGGDLLATARVAGHSPEIALEHYIKTGDLSAQKVRDRVNEINRRNAETRELGEEFID